jgi:hypothetical protein
VARISIRYFIRHLVILVLAETRQTGVDTLRMIDRLGRVCAEPNEGARLLDISR